jgi:type I restriction enzyme S subunit
MISEYTLKTLGECCHSIEDGDWIETKDQGDSGFRLLQISNIGLGTFRETGNYRWVTQETFNRLRCNEIRVGDVLVARMPDPTGRSWYVDKLPWPAITAVDVAIIRTDPKLLDSMYCSYFLNSTNTLSVVASLTVGTTRTRIKRTDLADLEIYLPSVKTQKKIADYLRTLDDRISLLRESNATIEAIVQALFKSWFVDFDPVCAKSEGLLPDGMDEATAAIFPDTFEETELGMVPRGWQVEPLDDVAEFLNGLALQKFPPTGVDDLPVIKIAQLRKGDTVGADLAAGSIKPKYVIQNGDVLFSWSGSLEVEIWCGGTGALNQHLFKVTSSRFQKWFFYLWTKHHLESFRQIAASKATTMGHIQRGHLSSAKVNVPSEPVLKVADALFAPLIERIVHNALQANTLANLRDTLLPRLISGQLRIADAEA